MSEPNQVILDTSQAKAALAELQTRLVALDKSFDGISAGKLLDEYKRLKQGAAEVEQALAKLDSRKGTSVRSMNRYKAELATLTSQMAQYKSSLGGVESLLAKQGSAVDGAKAASVSYRAVIDGLSHSYREAGKYSGEYVKQLAIQQAAAKESLTSQTRLGNEILAMQRRQAQGEKADRSAGVTYVRAQLENESRDRRLGLQQLMASNLEEQRVRKLGLAQTAAIAEDEVRTLRAATLARRAAQADSRFSRMDDLKRAQTAEKAAIDLAMKTPLAQVTSQYGAQATGLAQRQGLAALTSEVNRLSAAQAVSTKRTVESTKEFGRWSQAQWDAHSALRGVSGALGQLWLTYGALAPLLAGAAVGATIKTAVQAGSELEFQMTFVKALGDESAESMNKLSDAAKRLSTEGLFGPTEVAGGLRILAQAGLDANEALIALPSTLDLATVGEMKMEDAAITLVGVMNSFGKSVGDISAIGDMFAKAAAVSQVSVQDMTQSMRMASVVGEQYGASMEDTAAALTLLGQINIKGTAAGTSLRNMLKELFTPGKEAADTMKMLGLETSNAQNQLRSFPDIIFDLKTQLVQFDKVSQANILQRLFGERGAKEAVAMLSQTREEWDKLRSDVSEAGGFMREVASQLEATTKGSMAQAFNTLKVTMVETFESTEGAVGSLALQLKAAFGSDALKASLNTLASSLVLLLQAVAALTPAITALAAGWVALKAVMIVGSVWTATGVAVARFAGTIAAATGAMGPAVAGGVGLTAMLKGLGAAFTATSGPIGLAVTALAGFSYWIFNLSTSPTAKVVTDTQNLAAAMDSLRKNTDAASGALLEQMRAKGMVSGSQVDDASFDLDKAKEALAVMKATAEEKKKDYTLWQGVKDTFNVGGGIVQDSVNIRAQEKAVADAQKAFDLAKKSDDLLKDRQDQLKLNAAIEAQAARSQVEAGQRNLKGEDFINAGKKAENRLQFEIDALNKEYDLVKKAYVDQPKKLEEAKRAYEAQLAALREKDAGRNRPGPTDKSALFDVKDSRKLAEAEYKKAMVSVEFYKKGLDLRRSAALIGEDEYSTLLNQLADKEIALGIKREQTVQQTIKAALARNPDKEVQKRLQNERLVSIEKQGELEAKANEERAFRQIKEQIRYEKFLNDVLQSEADYYEDVRKADEEFYGVRLNAKEQFMREWVASDEGRLLERANKDGDVDSAARLTAIYNARKARATQTPDEASGYTAERAGADLARDNPVLFQGTQQAIDAQLAHWEGYYAKIKEMRAENQIDDATAAQLMAQVHVAAQQQMLQAYVDAAQARLDLGTGGWDEMMLTSLARVQEGFTTFESGTAELMGSFFESFTDGFANSVGRAVVYADDLNEALGNVAREALAGLISGLVKLGVQWMVNAAIGNSVQATAAATSAAITATQAAAAAAAWAPAAALASLASFGSNAAPAAAGLTATAALAQAIAATSYAGAFDKGGNIPSGKWGIVGEYGPEIVQGPASVTSRQKTAELMSQGRNSGPAAPAPAPIVNNRIINVLDPAVVGDYLGSDEGEQMIMNVVQRNRSAMA